jgi:hypothetical protein
VRKVKLSTSVKLSSREYGCQQAPVVTTEKRVSAFVNNEHWTEGLWFCVRYNGTIFFGTIFYGTVEPGKKRG